MTDKRKDEMPDAETQARWILKDVVGLTWDDSIKSIHMTPRSFTLCIQAAISRNCADLSPPVPDDVAEAVKHCQAVITQSISQYNIYANKQYPIGDKATFIKKHVETLIRAASTPSAEVLALRKALKWAIENAKIIAEFPDDAVKYANKTIGVCEQALNQTRVG